ncbi:hypothetical protein [Maioricimonas sp. JC845]|uniref:carboxypeptidase-like regulatory domain-containing protein n=1 Tax=Maioricimonas sp. JC845 TaxID=3232138 RepID=UPI003459BBCE
MSCVPLSLADVHRLLFAAALVWMGPRVASAQPTYELTGRVVDEEGQPIPGAIVAGQLRYPEPIRELARTDDEGRFRVPLDKPVGPPATWLYARGEGFGFVAALGDALERPKPGSVDVTFTLPRAVPIRGRLVDSEGNPAAGVRIRPYTLRRYDQRRRSTLAEAVAKTPNILTLQSMGRPVLIGENSELLLPWVETDDDGRFVIDSVGPDLLVGLMAVGTRVAARTILVRTDDGESVPVELPQRESTLTVHSYASVNETVAPSVPLMGKVTTAETGQPVAGATVSPWRLSGFHFQRAERIIASRTNADGEYALLGLPLGESRVFAMPPDDVPMVAVERFPRLSAEELLARMDFLMPRGVTVTGRVTDRITGEPVSGIIEAYAFNDNPHLEALEPSSLSMDRHTARVNSDGRFTIQVLPGPGILGFRASSNRVKRKGTDYRRGTGWDAIEHHRYREDGRRTMFRTEPTYLNAWDYHLIVEIDPPDDAESHTVDLVVGEKTTDVPLEFERPAGGPSQVYYSNATSDYGPFSLVTFDFRMQKLEPATIRFFKGETVRITQARSRDCKWAGWTRVEPTDRQARITLVAASAIRGRVVDGTGRPVADAELRTPFPHDPTKLQARIPSQPEGGYRPRTDEEGRFELVGLPADLPLTVEITITDPAANRIIDRRILLKELKLEVGETRDLEEIAFDELERPERR